MVDNPNNPKSGPIPPKSQTWQPGQAGQATLQPQVSQQTNTQLQRPDVDPLRERQPREEVHQQERRRRKSGTLNRMAQYKLDFIDAEYLDLDNYVYRWVNDEFGKIRMATRHDDYEYVNIEELNGFDPEGFDSEGGGHIRMLVGESRLGGPLYAYLLKKRRSFWEADNEAVVQAREDMMAGRVYRAELDEEEGMRDPNFDRSNYYASKDNQIGGAAERRRGPLPKRVIK